MCQRCVHLSNCTYQYSYSGIVYQTVHRAVQKVYYNKTSLIRCSNDQKVSSNLQKKNVHVTHFKHLTLIQKYF